MGAGEGGRDAEVEVHGGADCHGAAAGGGRDAGAEICRRLQITEATFYRWKKKYGGLGVPELRELRQLREENRRPKGLVADLSLDREILQEAVRKKW